MKRHRKRDFIKLHRFRIGLIEGRGDSHKDATSAHLFPNCSFNKFRDTV